MPSHSQRLLTIWPRRVLASRRRAFTLLEVLIALGILGVLMAIIWSMMENFQSLEQRGHQQTHRSRALRSLQDQLQSDLLHLSRFSPPATPLPSPAPSSTSRRRNSAPTSRSQAASASGPTFNSFQFAPFAGDSMGCQMTILVPSNPVPVLDAALQPQDGPVWLPHQSIEPPRARVFYQLEEEPNVPQSDPTFRLRRKVVVLPDRLQQAMQAPKDLGRNLERRDPDESESNMVVLDTSYGIWETVWDHLVNPRFRYRNQDEWVSHWGGGDVPKAVELSFDFESNRQRKEREAAEWEAYRTGRTLESETSSILRPSLVESSMEEEVPKRDVRLVLTGVGQ